MALTETKNTIVGKTNFTTLLLLLLLAALFSQFFLHYHIPLNHYINTYE